MISRVKNMFLTMGIGALVLAAIVSGVSLLSGESGIFEIGFNLLATGVTLAVIIFPIFYRSHHRNRIRINLQLSVEERNKLVLDTYYDYFAGISFAPILSAVMGFLLMLFANSLGQRVALVENKPFVGSVRPALVEMHDIARQTFSDAQLLELEYNFGDKSNNDFILTAQFGSFVEPGELLTINLTRDGKYVEKTYEVPPTKISNPILADGWMDANEAINFFAQDKDLRVCINYPDTRVKTLVLTQSYSMENEDVMWCIYVEECVVTDLKTCINAMTGKKINFEN